MDVDSAICSSTQLLKLFDSLFKLHKLKAIKASEIAEITLEPNCKIPYVNIALLLLLQDFFSVFDSVIVKSKFLKIYLIIIFTVIKIYRENRYV